MKMQVVDADNVGRFAEGFQHRPAVVAPPYRVDGHGQIEPRQLTKDHLSRGGSRQTRLYDGISESLTQLNNNFAIALARMRATEIEQTALDWATTFPYEGSLQHTPAYKSLLRLQEVALATMTRNTSLLFYLDGAPCIY